jgi:hypothetical protein
VINLCKNTASIACHYRTSMGDGNIRAIAFSTVTSLTLISIFNLGVGYLPLFIHSRIILRFRIELCVCSNPWHLSIHRLYLFGILFNIYFKVGTNCRLLYSLICLRPLSLSSDKLMVYIALSYLWLFYYFE